MKKISIALILCLCVGSLFAQEVISNFDDKGLVTLNEELRKAQNNKDRYIYFVMPEDTLTTGTDKTGRIYVDFSGKITQVYASVNTAPTGANLIIDINKNGSTIWTTAANRATILATEYTETQETFNITDFKSGDYFTLDIDQVGSTVAGAKLTVRVKAKANE
jgi:hypothetical protein